MKASDLLALVKESSKGTKKVDGELKTPTYDNMHTPDNHVSGKGTKEVKNAKKDFGKKRDKKNPANPGKPSKGEKRGMGGPGKSYKRLGEAGEMPTQAGNVEKIQHVIFRSVQDLDVASGRMVVAPDRLTARTLGVQPGKPINIQMDPEDMASMLKPAVAQIKKAGTAQDALQAWHGFLKSATGGAGMKRTASSGRKETSPNVYKGATPQAPQWGLQDSIGESYADGDSMKKDQPVKKRGPVSKTAKVRGKVNDEPENKGDPGKPKSDGKDVMGDGANLGKIMNPKQVKKVTEGLKALEKIVGRKLKIK